MPITLPFVIRNLSQPEFDEIDRLVMRRAYDAQNELGRLCEERVYENKLASLLRAGGLKDVQTQLPVTVTHATFEKVYRLDLVVGHAIYELKTAHDFAPQHDAQAFHYAIMANVNHIKLLNFRTAKVRGLLRFNAVLAADRNPPQWRVTAWRAVTSACETLRQRLSDLVADWGTHLDPRLVEEALAHFCGGEAACLRRVPVVCDGLELGTHPINTHADGVCFVVTSFPEPSTQRSHLKRLRRLTGQRAIQWMNLNKREIELVTIVD